VDFSSFIIGLATQALVFLGEIPDPQTGERALTLDAARNYIDILAMLEQKTEGNLTENEKKLLQEVLTSVRMAFVHKARE
jgi:hypothetical protein